MVRGSNLRGSFAGTLLLALLLPVLAACGGTQQATTSATSAPAVSNATSAPATGGAATAVPAAISDAGTAATTAPVATSDASVAATAAPAATSAAGGTASTPGGKVLRIQESTYPETIDPQKMSVSNEIMIAQLNYEGLTKLDKDLKAVPAAAKSWKFNDKGDQMTFTLQDNLKYSDGSPLTAKNFQFAVERTCDPATAGEYQSILFEIKGCETFATTAVTDTTNLEKNRQALLTDGVQAPDDKTLVLNFTKPAPYYTYVAGLWVFYPVKQELIASGGEAWWKDVKNQVGNGPFQVTQLEEDQVATFAANTNYWGGKPKLDGIQFVFQKSAAVAIEAYRAGQLDIVSLNTDPSQIPTLKADPALGPEVVSNPGANTFAWGFNLTMEPFSDKNVREAFAYAFDAKTYCEVIRSGDCSPVGSWIPQGVAGALDASNPYEFNADKAKAALAASKYKNAAGLPEIKLSYNSDDPATQARVEWISGQLRDVLGVDAKLDPIEGKTINAARKDVKTYPQVCLFCSNWFQDYPDPQNWISVYWRSDAFAARIGYKSDKLDQLSSQADVELDEAKRTELYKQANQVLIDDLPAPFAYSLSNVFLVKPYVKGYTPTSADSTWPGERGSIMDIDVQK